MRPWLDPRGRFSPLKASAFALLLLPAGWNAALFAAGDLGARPLDAALHEAGLWALRLLLVTLSIIPLVALLKWPLLVLLRRMSGVATFCYALLHLLLFTADKEFLLDPVATEIALRIYLTIGFAALLAFTTLAATSTDGALRLLGARRWRRLHLLVYPAAVLAVVHHMLQSKIDVGEPLAMAGLLAWLLAFRALAHGFGSPGRIPPAASVASLGLACPLTALGEAAWYGLVVGVDPAMLLAANFMPDAGIRPAWIVAAVTLPLAAAVIARGPKAPARPQPAAT
ncbi:MAG: sulfoxide reductase heme-binding subunit YedZ [Alphaproteobacteria bacterium]|nr:sulfoxide reductase heme-binding subunit YedZ [Alphaproteobacteria bacterium]